MNAAVLSPDAARLRAVRDSLAAIAPAEWTRVHDSETGAFIEARGDMGEIVVLARFDPAATLDEIAFAADAPDTVRFLLRLLDAAFGEIRALKGIAPPAGRDAAKDYAAECSMRCTDPAFKAFLEQRHGLERPLTDERVAQHVRGLLGVTSRRELNDGGSAAAAWKDLRGDFEAWKRTGR